MTRMAEIIGMTRMTKYFKVSNEKKSQQIHISKVQTTEYESFHLLFL